MQIMIDSKLKIVSNQVQYSIIDRRPEVKMVRFCLKHNISLLAYGTLCGGLMSERWLGKIQPSATELNTLSLRKYKKMIDAKMDQKKRPVPNNISSSKRIKLI